MDRALDDFHLRFERAGGDDWRVLALCTSMEASDTAPMNLAALPPALTRLWQASLPLQRDLAVDTASASQSLQQLGETLFRAAFGGGVEICLRAGLDHARRRGRGLRIWIHARGRPELESLPWEILYDPRGGRFLAQSEDAPVVRYLEDHEPLKRAKVEGPLRILIPTAQPVDRNRLEAERELNEITEALAERVKLGDAELEHLGSATLAQLRLRLERGGAPCHVLHFICHAGFDAALQDGAMVIENGRGGSSVVDARHLGPVLLDHDPLQLLVLNACDGARMSRTVVDDASAGLAQALMRNRIPAVIAMQSRVSNSAAIAFAKHFYAALATGCGVDVALSRCRRAMYLDSHEVEWGAPVLYLRSARAPLLPVRSRSRTAVAAGAARPAPATAERPATAALSTIGQAAPPASEEAATPSGAPSSWRRVPRLTLAAGLVVLVGLGLFRLVLDRFGGTMPAAPAVHRTTQAAHGPAVAAASAPEVQECPPAADLTSRFMRLGPGTFLMGSLHGGAADERPAHYVTLSPFCLSAFEVTQEQWQTVMGEEANQSSRRGKDLPVENVSWNDAQAFLSHLNALAGRERYRLPTEAEWEYAARAGSASIYSFGDDSGELYRYGNCKSEAHDDGFDRTAPVGTFAPNRWGLYDLYGNVSEWVDDAYGHYGAGPLRDPHVRAGSLRVRRGGSWKIVAGNCRSAFRNKSLPSYRSPDVGFRVVRLLD